MAAESSDESEDERRKARAKKEKLKKANLTTTSNVDDTTVPSNMKHATASTSKAVTAPVAKIAAKASAPKDLGTSDAMLAAQARLAALRAQQAKLERRIAAGNASDSEVDGETKVTKSKSKKSRGDDDISEAETGKVTDPKEELQRSKTQLADLQMRAKKNARPAERRTQHLPIRAEDLDEDELDEDEEQEQEKPKKKRGRPRKEIVEDAPPRPSVNRYRTGNNETGRVRWTRDEDMTLLFAIEALYYRGELTKPWGAISQRHGIHGTEDQVLAERNVQQMRDRARNIVIGKIKRGEEVPEYLGFITLPAAYR